MSEHTPTPWHADPDDREGYEWNIHILDESGINRICFMSNGPATEANAAFVVNAVNSHDALVKALENLLRFLDDATDYELQHASDYGAYLDAKAALTPIDVGPQDLRHD